MPGGTDDVNDKPNYLSVMNYCYQLRVWFPRRTSL
ncbi:hypothetical protein RMDY18_18390 [Rothia mucilaginosa DY-18]|uniref:Uncharacterized protein n=1 Tax=Rothia mucilaginosa (strain DY-18) TaxID=680646 RepID=D2NPV3_ROTMD|nr:hypothetical protein RMDY18_18390 [Rothia mucilaginosa DY-18]